jgi:ankyrin repeat protein
LLKRGAEVNARDVESGATPLYYAASWGRTGVVRFLLEHGAGPGVKTAKGTDKKKQRK